jgi:hypothetical protein
LRCSNRGEGYNRQYIQRFRFAKDAGKRPPVKIADCIAARALRACAANDATAAKACYNNAQAVEIRPPLD